MRRAYLLTTTAIAVVYLTVLLTQGLIYEVSVLREIAAQRAAVTRLSSCADSIGFDLPRYLRSDIEGEILRAAPFGTLPNASKIVTEGWRRASYDYLASERVGAEVVIGTIEFRREDKAPDGALRCISSISYKLLDRTYDTELQDRRSISFVVPVRIYLMSEVASGFRSSIAGKIRRAFLSNKGTDADAVSRIISRTIQEYERSCATRELRFACDVGMEYSRGNDTTKVFVSFDDLQVTDISPATEISVNGAPTRVTFKAGRSSITLIFRRN